MMGAPAKAEQRLRRKKAGQSAAKARENLRALVRTLRTRQAELESENRARRQSRDRLRAALDAAEEDREAKNRFLANMSHELRTPMTAILGFTDLLTDSAALDDEGGRYLEAIRRNGLVLLRLIDDILDLSRIEGGMLAVDRVRVSPWQILEEVLSLTRIRAEEKGLLLQSEYRYPLPEWITSDPVRLRQILVNLVGNAVKFTERGGVRVVVAFSNPDGTSPRLHFSVRDTGIGISPEGLKNLFQPFTQVGSSVTRRFGGSGLGLAISEQLAGLLGGQIEAASRLGQGSTFTLTVAAGPPDGIPMLFAPPEPRARSRQAASAAAERFRGSILLVEDDPDSRGAVRIMLQKAGLEVDEAENGQMAYRMALAAERSPYDVILMDVQMPEMDGYEATRRLRSAGWKGVVVALTAHAMSEERQKCLGAGCDDYLSKPITQQALAAALARHLKPQTGSPAPRGGPRQRPAALHDPSIDEAQRAATLGKFIRRLPERLREIDLALSNRDHIALERAAHALAGAAGLFGFVRMSRSAGLLEVLAEQQADLQELSTSVRDLSAVCRAAVQAHPPQP